ncbi:phosphoenolpyruvate synthase [Seinonella peptonophila]|uniref:Phosphoenolpyruvate synthase n=1 Tax=Seinonella peptonophila TaxID=112248 RepID=A0A1M4XJ14_9BACL|nr:phosphoenolpyruvate synthase [Seinonella peptonophila]SHE93386.1 phosphoenolpyruvate synthase [Seinonella peptonophila]
MGRYIRDFTELGNEDVEIVGGKGANLGEMTRAGFPIPSGFCLTTEAYRLFSNQSPNLLHWLEQLDQLKPEEQAEIEQWGKKIRTHLRQLTLQTELIAEIRAAFNRLGQDQFYAVRSSATAEDLPTASFAGQQDTYLNVRGERALIEAIQNCFISLFTDRAITYRSKQHFSHQSVSLSVVVQEMVLPEVSGILFTADPVSGDREVVSIDASYGLGEALVSGWVSPDLYQIRRGQVIKEQIAEKKIAILPLESGGTERIELPKRKQKAPALHKDEILSLATLGKQIEQHYGQPQDIEWAIAKGKIYILQARPITSLYPLPKPTPADLHLYFSFGHLQMMTEALKPLALSLFRTCFPFGKRHVFEESQLMVEAGSRLFVDLTTLLKTSVGKRVVPRVLRQVIDSQLQNAVEQFIAKEEFQAHASKKANEMFTTMLWVFWYPLRRGLTNFLFGKPERFHQKIEKVLAKLDSETAQVIEQTEGSEQLRMVQIQSGKMLLNIIKNAVAFVIPGLMAMFVLKNLLRKWLDREDSISILNKSLEGNVTSEMGLALGDVAEKARSHHQLIQYLQQAHDQPNFLEQLDSIEGSADFKQAFASFLNQYGVRCPGEIDISRPRWQEEPGQLFSSILSHLKREPGEHRKQFDLGKQTAIAETEYLLQEVRKQRGGWWKRWVLQRLIRLFRYGMALREHHKYYMMRIFSTFRRSILDTAQQLVDQGLLKEVTDVYYLRLDELVKLRAGADETEYFRLIEQRKDKFRQDIKRKAPRTFTSRGEVITGQLQNQRDLADGVWVGNPVSSGVVEGIARVVLTPNQAELEKEEILVAPFTDPGWTPLFLSAKGLVLEVGGMMTHGAVVAREYGIPAVVGVENATETIQTGDRIRVDGTQGIVERIEK